MSTDIFASPALPLLLRLEVEGFDVRADGDRLRVRPPDRVTPELRAELVRFKAELITLVKICDSGVQDRREAFRCQLDGAPAGRVPAFLFRPGVPYVMGVCFSCGDALPEPRLGRCSRCAVAWRLAAGMRVASDFILAEALDAARCA